MAKKKKTVEVAPGCSECFTEDGPLLDYTYETCDECGATGSEPFVPEVLDSGLCRVRLAEPWGERPAGSVVVVDQTRAAQMIAAGLAEGEPNGG